MASKECLSLSDRTCGYCGGGRPLETFTKSGALRSLPRMSSVRPASLEVGEPDVRERRHPARSGHAPSTSLVPLYALKTIRPAIARADSMVKAKTRMGHTD